MATRYVLLEHTGPRLVRCKACMLAYDRCGCTTRHIAATGGTPPTRTLAQLLADRANPVIL